MYNLSQPGSFSTLKEYYLPAFHQPIKVGKKKMYRLSIPFDGKDIQIKRSTKKIKHASFAKVILGAVLRMKKLFHPDRLNLGTIINIAPSLKDLTIEFELINKNKFIIANEEYLLSIVAKYAYSKSDIVIYYPILYRQICTNGAVAILNEQFKETISVDKILEIGCEWTKCNFESYINLATNYFEWLKRLTDNQDQLGNNADLLAERILGIKRKPRRKSQKINFEISNINNKRDINNYLSKNLSEIGYNQFAVFNTLTEYASNEPSLQLRHQYFMAIGKYLSKEMKNSAKINKELWSDNLTWDDVNKII